jgi:hypothetical protein
MERDLDAPRRTFRYRVTKPIEGRYDATEPLRKLHSMFLGLLESVLGDVDDLHSSQSNRDAFLELEVPGLTLQVAMH